MTIRRIIAEEEESKTLPLKVERKSTVRLPKVRRCKLPLQSRKNINKPVRLAISHPAVISQNELRDGEYYAVTVGTALGSLKTRVFEGYSLKRSFEELQKNSRLLVATRHPARPMTPELRSDFRRQCKSWVISEDDPDLYFEVQAVNPRKWPQGIGVLNTMMGW